MEELAIKKLELMGLALIKLIQFPCDYFRTEQPGTNKRLPPISFCFTCIQYHPGEQITCLIKFYEFILHL